MSILQPKARRFRGARRFQQHGKLQRLSVLRLVQNDAKVFFANPLRSDRMLQQLFRKRDLISVGDESVVESKIEIITLHLRRDAGGRIAHPFSQRRKLLLPEVVVFGYQLERRWQTEIMTEVGQEFHAERVDRAEEGAIERSLHFVSQIFLEQRLPRALLHFVRRTIGEGDDDQTRQSFRGVRRTRDRQDAPRDRSGFARTRRCDYRKIVVQLAGETSAHGFIARLHHVSHSSFSSTSAGCASAHLSSKMSLSMCNVARG